MTTPGERLAQLKTEHGSLNQVLEKTSEYTYLVYDEYGDISYKSTEEPTFELQDKKVAKLKTIDCKIIDEKGKGIGQFIIDEDEHEVCHIKLKTYDVSKINSSKDFLTEVTSSTANVWDIKLKLYKSNLTITKNSKIKEKVNNNLKFYITEYKDPHFVLEKFFVEGNNLQDEGTVKLPHTLKDISNVSIYTSKIYDKYVRQ
ncbi:hypothetical protein OAQ62_00430 [bacterium]|nr:hypothetical protein [bacterium]